MKKNKDLWDEIGATIEESIFADTPEDYEDIEIPKDFDEKMLKLVQAADAANAEKAKRSRRKKYVQLCASIIIVITLAGTITIGSVDAWRTKYFGFLTKQNEGNVEITPRGDENQMLSDWSGYWYPEYLPEDFKLTGVDETFEVRTMLFEKEDDDMVISLVQCASDVHMGVDTDTNVMSKIEVNGYEGYLFVDKTYMSVMVIWMMNDCTFSLSFENSVDSELALEMAESLKYIQ